VKAWAAAHANSADLKAHNRALHQFADRWRDAGHVGEKVFAELQAQWAEAFGAARAPIDAAQKGSIERRLGEKIHVVEARNASSQHLGACEQSPVRDELRRHVARLGRPDVLIEPARECAVVGQPAHQRHRRMRVRVDEPGNQHVLGEIDGAWKQATSELAYERSGPERFLETFYVLSGLVRALGDKPDIRSAEGLGRLVAQLHTLRRMSVSVNGMLQAGKELKVISEMNMGSSVYSTAVPANGVLFVNNRNQLFALAEGASMPATARSELP